MPKDRNLLFVIADGALVRFVRPAEDNALHTVDDVAPDQVPKHFIKPASDRPRASFHSAWSAHHAVNPRHDPHALEKEKFAHSIANRLNTAATCGAFDEVVLVAPPHTLHAIREALSQEAAARVIGTLEKDLIKTPDNQLWPHIRQWVRPVHRTGL